MMRGAIGPVIAAAAALLACGCADAAPAVQAPVAAPRMGVVLWQQFCEQAWNVPQASALVAARGAEGWELVAMYNGVLCYKRPAGEPLPPRARIAPAPPSMAPGPVPIVRDPGF